VKKLKETWWKLRDEASFLLLEVVCGLPTGAGDWLRYQVLRRVLGHLGEATVLKRGLLLLNPEKIFIGSNCDLSRRVFITGGGGVRIGNWVGIGPDAKIWSVNHRFEDPDQPWLLQGWEHKEVVIEDDVWVGAAVFVMPGVTIGKGAIISACSVVSKSIPPYAIVAGNPGRVIGWRRKPVQSGAGPADARSTIDDGEV